MNSEGHSQDTPSVLAQRYFVQRAELYQDEFYLDYDLGQLAKHTGVAAPSLEGFYQRIKACQKCRLAKSRTNFVFGVGNPNADLMCIGEAPGYEEDREGEPFVGAAGQLLNKILAAIGFRREEVYIANIVKCRPPGNRDPEPEEISECLPYLRQQIEMVQPRLILALGRIAAQTLLQTEAALGSLRGKTHRYESRRVIVTYHPAALLRNVQYKRATWDDVRYLREEYDREVGDKPPLESPAK